MADATLYNYTIVTWDTVPAAYDTVNIYKSNQESQGYNLLTSVPSTTTQYTDSAVNIAAKDSWFYAVVFSNSVSGAQSAPQLAWKMLTPREQKLVFQLRDIVSRFVSNRLADEELRQYIEHGLNTVNVYSPQTSFTLFSLPGNLESLVVTSAAMYGILFNMLGIGMTDINVSDHGMSMQWDRYGKMSQTLKDITAQYNSVLQLAKLEYAPSGTAIGTVQLPIGVGGRIASNLLSTLDMFQNLGR